MGIIPYGDQAILINFENKIDLTVNQKVIGISNYLNESKPIGFRYCIPSYCSLTVVYDPLVTSFKELSTEIISIDNNSDSTVTTNSRVLKIPVCYSKQHAPDLEAFAKTKSISVEEIIAIHSSQVYHVYMLGFLPGFAYLGKSPESLMAERLASPRLKVPTGSVGLAGLQTGIYPCESPGGWQLIGRTPIKTFDEDRENPSLFKVGDKITFRSISNAEYKDIEVDIILNKFDHKSLIDVGN